MTAPGRIAEEGRALLVAVRLLTRLPAPDPGVAPGLLRRSMRAFAPVGALVGLGAAAVWYAGCAVLPPAVAAGLALAAGIALSGGLHEDGLADTADGLGAIADRGRRLEILRDSRIGTFGVLALVLALGLRWAALAALAPAEGAVALVLAAATGRALMVPATALAAPARPVGLGAALAPGAGPAELGAAAGAVALLALAAGQAGGLAVAAAALAGWLVLRAARRGLGGYTGDVLGAVAVTGETAVLVALAGAWA